MATHEQQHPPALESPNPGLFEHILTHYRGLFAVLVLLPVSLVYGAYAALRNRIVFQLRSAPTQHAAKVQNVARQIEAWKADGAKQRLCTARSGWETMSELVPSYKLTHRKIDVGLYDILEIDGQIRTVRVEPLVTMGQLTRTLLPLGWTLPVVPELDDLTVGGLIMGFGVESSSHKHGLFQSICIAYEIVTADGQILHCSAAENAELFHAIPWSHGTLGFLVSATLKLIPARRYVRLHYQPVRGLDELVAAFEEASRAPEAHDFVEGLVYDRDSAVIMRGTLTDEIAPDGRVNAIGRWYQPWFYRHVQRFLARDTEGVEYVPLRQYYHRHTRSYFWTMEEIIPFGDNPIFRWLLGWTLPPRVSLLKYTETETTRRLRERLHVIQDLLMPMATLKASIEYLDEHYGIYPLWLSPMAIYADARHTGFVQPCPRGDGSHDELYVDVGVYGSSYRPGFDNRRALPQLESFVIDQHGYQALYATTMLSRDAFRRMFDHTAYDRLRAQLPLCTQAFDEVYDKVSTKGRVSPVEMRKIEKHAKGPS
ncbi:FAD-binding oxidoreductase [Methylolobus aquaticus]|nr:FAD-binding oxidoreductase [Methylolobus aquaticus]